MIWKNIPLKNKLKEIAKKNSEIEDIILFGSVVRGKEKPNDIDILLLFKNKINKDIEYTIRKEIEKHFKNISLLSKNIKTLYDSFFDAREGIFFEGISLLSGKQLCKKYGFSPLGMFKYEFKNWNKLKKTKFYYALNGRGTKKGIIEELHCIKLSDGIVLVPLPAIEKMKDFLESWEIKYIYIPILLPERLNKKEFLE